MSRFHVLGHRRVCQAVDCAAFKKHSRPQQSCCRNAGVQRAPGKGSRIARPRRSTWEEYQMSKRLLKLGVMGLCALTFTLVLTAANAQERVRWKMQSAF